MKTFQELQNKHSIGLKTELVKKELEQLKLKEFKTSSNVGSQCKALKKFL